MAININITVDLTDGAKEWIMSVLSDKIAEVGTKVDAAATRITTDVTNLKAQIAALQAQIAAGGASQADLDALTALEAKLEQIDPATPTTVPAA